MKDTKRRVLAEGLNMLTQSGFGNLTVGGLAQRTKMSKSGLFAHFGSKQDVELELLQESLRVATATVVTPALEQPPGLGRLRAVVYGWFGWTVRAGLDGGCPMAAGVFELDDASTEDPVRRKLVEIEQEWRTFLLTMVSDAVKSGELRSDLALEQFVWELSGIYLNHHVSARFLRDPNANARAHEAFESLITRSTSSKKRPSNKSSEQNERRDAKSRRQE